ncbi:hypothetical protein DFJ73DRAFT_864374 [Zopfochytrium polystomum]|nr:hypothetical protein DFJ73DRAFT_864374 [Zopfochytrium polystomum]
MDVVAVKTGLDGGVLLFESGVVSETARLRWVALGTASAKVEPKTAEAPGAGSALAASENLRNDVLLQLPVVPSSLKGVPPHLQLPDGDFVLFVSQGIYEYERGFFLCAVWRIRWDGGSVLETAWSTLIDFYASKSGTDMGGELLVMLSELTGEVAVVDARTGKDRSTPDPSPSAGETLTFEQADVQIPNLRDIYSVRKLLWRTVPRAWAAPSPPRKERKKSKPSNAATDDSSCGDVDVKVGGDGDRGDEPAIEWVASGLDSGTSDLVSILRLRPPVDAVEEDAERDSWHLTVTPARRVAEVGYADAIAAVLPTQNGDENAVRARACQLPGDAIKALANISGKWNGARSMPVLRVTAGQGFVAVTGKTHKFLVVRLSELT